MEVKIKRYCEKMIKLIDGSNKNKKVLLITNIPTPYRIPLFNLLSEKLSKNNINFEVIFAQSGYSYRKWEIDLSECMFKYKILKSKYIYINDNEHVMFLYSGIIREILRANPDRIIVGGFSVATLKIYLLSLIKKINYLIWSGSINTKGRSDSICRRIYRKKLIKNASAYIAYGRRAKEYLISLGANPNKIEIGINTIDVSFYSQQTAHARLKTFNDNKFIFLIIGHLSKRKRVDQVLIAINRLKKRRNICFLIIGDGAERERLIGLTKTLNIEDLVQFEGFKQKSEIPGYLAIAKCMLFPSEYDIWGLVLVEAMTAGLLCISSVNAGATSDLIEDGKTGFAIDFSETDKVVEKIEWVLEHPTEAKMIGENAAKFINSSVNLEKSASGFVRAIDYSLKRN